MIDAVDYEAAVERIVTAAKKSAPLAVSALAVHGVMTSVLDRVHRYRLNKLDLTVPDGQPVRWALNALHGAGLQQRVYGPTLMLRTCERAAAEGLPIFLFGGTEQLLELLSNRLCERFPNLQIAGTLPSKFRRLEPNEKQEVVDTIRASGATITFVGLGCPRQEVWAFEFREALSMPLLAVGAAFNFHAGLLAQAPPLMQRLGLEWLFRLVCEPRRLWKRYMLLNPAYLTLFALQLTRLRTIDASSGLCPEGELRYG
jgi:exopolysaccharide biosynthesis WecB/TagA/CpsF family protein